MSFSRSQDQVDLVMAVPRYKQTRLWTYARSSWVGEWVRAGRRLPRELWAWASLRRVTHPTVEEFAKAIATLQVGASVQEEIDTEAPIFLLSTGWRAGSTLLQRILVTDPNLILWGEPLGEMALVSRLTEMVSHCISDRNLKEWRNQPPLDPLALSKSWIANLYPPGGDFRSSLRCVFDRWLAQPARDHGFTRWGMKEVRIGATEASLLHWLYPNAKFLIISRHPFDCYRSLVDSGWGKVYDRYPDVPINSAASFARHWNRLVVSWSELPKDFPVVSLKYEDLVSGKVDCRKLESWLGIKIQEGAALSVSVGGTASRSRLNWCERLIIRYEACEGMRAMGYRS
jgi:Sulfotransferase family